jgi:stearoyl-CoA desaturase (delta-9 desaturase)
MSQPTMSQNETTIVRRYRWLTLGPVALCHLAVFGAIWSGVTVEAVVVGVVLYVVRMFGVTAGYHRYFSHRSYKTSRPVQFLLALLAESSSQKGVLWWAAHHRHHHNHADAPADRHSPLRDGFLHAHVGWITEAASDPTDFERVRDLTRFPELVWLDRHWVLPPLGLAIAVLLLFGWPGLFIGFFASTVLLWHGTWLVNSATHLWGSRRYATPDGSRNNALVALVTLGEGWHNNHHRYQGASRQGFFWWELDVTYYVLRLAAALRLVSQLKEPPPALLAVRVAEPNAAVQIPAG